jgi:hypothetical protein
VVPVVSAWRDVKCGLFISCSYQISLKYIMYVHLCKECAIIDIIM